MEFIELPAFSREIDNLLSLEEFRVFQNELIQSPQKGDLLKGAAGARKIRARFGASGKSGAARVVYYYVGRRKRIWFLSVYPKSKKEALSKAETALIRKIVDHIKVFEKGAEHGS